MDWMDIQRIHEAAEDLELEEWRPLHTELTDWVRGTDADDWPPELNVLR